MKIIIYTTRFCPYCIRAKQLLNQLGLEFEEKSVDFDRELRKEMEVKSGRKTVPQIWINDEHIGGCDELFAKHRQGSLI